MNTTGNTPDALMDTYHARRALERVVCDFLYAQFGQPPIQPESEAQVVVPLRSGQVIEWRRYDSLASASTPITEGVTPADCDMTLSTIQATLLQYGCPIKMTDKFIGMSLDDAMAEAIDQLADQAMLTWDDITSAIVLAGTNVQFAGAATSRATVDTADKLTGAEIGEAVVALKNGKAKKWMLPGAPPSYVGITTPAGAEGLMQDSAWIDAAKYANPELLQSGELGRFKGVRWFESNNPTNNVAVGAGVGGIDVHQTLIFGRQFFGLPRLDGAALQFITKPLGSGGAASDPMDLIASAAWKSCFVATILNENFGRRIEHAE